MSLSTLKRQKFSIPGPRSPPYLPEDVIIDILKRLPVKSLLKFRCVSKVWLALLSSPEFAKTHLSFQSENEDKLMTFDILNGNGNLSLFSILHNKSSTCSIMYDRSLEAPERAFRFLGSCNGLLCFRAKAHRIIVWNPSTGKIKKIPDVSGYEYLSLYGFGVDIEKDNFKIVYAYQHNTRENGVLVYSFRSGVWEKFQGGFRRGLTFPNIAVCVSGALNWCNNSLERNNWQWDIISFDLATHTSRVMQLPRYEMGAAVHISESRGLLFASCLHKGEMKVWMMKEYGVEGSWTMLVSVPNLPTPPLPLDMEEDNSIITISDAVSVVFVSEDADILMRVLRRLRLYKSKTKSCCNFETPEPFNVGIKAISYVETLISPCLPDDEVGDQRHQ